MSGPLDRRTFLRLGGGALVLLGTGTWSRAAEGRSQEPVLVVLFQRGAADGVHMIIPYRERPYRSARGILALPDPGRAEDRPFDLGDGFGLHPALRPLAPMYEEGRLAVVHAVGSPDPTRSHFDAQDYMETGTPGIKGTRDGWLARALEAVGSDSPFGAVSLTANLPRSLSGASNAIASTDFRDLANADSLEDRIMAMYQRDANPAFAEAGDEASRALQMFRTERPLERRPRDGADYPRGRTGQALRTLAGLLKANLGVRIAFVESGGWDTHVNQGGATGTMARLLSELSRSVTSFFHDVGSDRPVTLLTMTEFGRTVAVNGAVGTDHGHGTAMMVMGDGVAGGRVVADWPGLSSRNLYQGRDLEVTTDFRNLFAEVASHALGVTARGGLFPGAELLPVGVMRTGA